MNCKTCSKCKTEKNISNFHKHKMTKDGYGSWCKICYKEYRRKYYLKNRIKQLNQTKILRKKCRWYLTYNDVYQRCNNPNAISYKNYGAKGIECLMKPNDFKFLWFRDKAYDMEQPSIHRKKKDKNYIINNCKFIEMKEHRKHKRGKYNKGGK